MNFIKPKIMISKCLEFEACRYDGQMINNQYIQSLKEFIDFMPICPEVEIGMGTPRDPIRIVKNKNVMSLYQESTRKDYAKKMTDFSKVLEQAKEKHASAKKPTKFRHLFGLFFFILSEWASFLV